MSVELDFFLHPLVITIFFFIVGGGVTGVVFFCLSLIGGQWRKTAATDVTPYRREEIDNYGLGPSIDADGNATAGTSSKVFPAYREQHSVEFFSQDKCFAAQCSARIVSDPNRDMLVYAVTLQGSTHMDATLDAMREPLQQGEPCEIFSAKDDKWVAAEVGERRTGMQVTYQIVDLTKSTASFSTHLASEVRRRFVTRSSVEVYRGPWEGWVPATVVEGRRLPVASDDIEKATRTPWEDILVELTGLCSPGESRVLMVPSYLLRPADSPNVAALQRSAHESQRDDPPQCANGKGSEVLIQPTDWNQAPSDDDDASTEPDDARSDVFGSEVSI